MINKKFIRNNFKLRLKSGEKLHGLWFSSCSPIIADVIRDSGYDWVLIDMEHSINTTESVANILRCFRDSETSPIVRPPVNDPVEIKRLLDVGVKNFLFPLTESVDMARQAVASTRYKAKGGLRGVSLGQCANHFGRISDYFDKANQDITVILQVESAKAISLVPELASVDGVDGLFVGPADLSDDMGKTGQTFESDVQEKIGEFIQLCKESSIPAGSLIFNEEMADKYYSDGFSFISCASDLSLLKNSADTQAQKFVVSVN
jgi:2-keto-3-deoxy-L-rhamnonate aldolase RhmA